MMLKVCTVSKEIIIKMSFSFLNSNQNIGVLKYDTKNIQALKLSFSSREMLHMGGGGVQFSFWAHMGGGIFKTLHVGGCILLLIKMGGAY